MSHVIPIPEAIKEPPSDAKIIKDVWIEIHTPPDDKMFVDYRSAGPQLAIRVHYKDQIVGDYMQYVYDGWSMQGLTDFLDDTLDKCGITSPTDRKKIWDYRVTYKDGIPTYKNLKNVKK